MKPDLEIYAHVSAPEMDPAFHAVLLDASKSTLDEILTLPEGPEHVLSLLETVEISIVDDPAISEVHARFLDDPSPTDVITFPHGDGLGEIMVSIDTAVRQASEYGEPWERELFRYIVHGLLHLHGYLDDSKERRDEMFSFQEPLVMKHAMQGRS